jgi:hypothetical protein
VLADKSTVMAATHSGQASVLPLIPGDIQKFYRFIIKGNLSFSEWNEVSIFVRNREVFLLSTVALFFI